MESMLMVSKKGGVAIMQPTFIPWAGYFNLIANSNIFVFLDDVQLERQSWQTRNKLLYNGKISWVSIPVRNERLSQTIIDTTMVNSLRWYKKLISGFDQNYKTHPHYESAREILLQIEVHLNGNLANLNESIIRYVSDRLNLEAQFVRSSELQIDGVRSDRLISICKFFGAERYLSPKGSEAYLLKDNFQKKTSCELVFQNYVPSEYLQRKANSFISHLSVVDVVANLGWDFAREYVEGGGHGMQINHY